MVKLLEYVKGLPGGDYAECGVFQGDSAALIQQYLPDGVRFFLFDTYTGHPEPSHLDSRFHPKGRYSATSTNRVRERFGGDDRIVIVPGEFKDTLPAYKDCWFRFVNLDCDLYQSYVDCLKFFITRMVPQGIIRIDDYQVEHCPGCVKAVDEIVGDRLVDRNYILF